MQPNRSSVDAMRKPAGAVVRPEPELCGTRLGTVALQPQTSKSVKERTKIHLGGGEIKKMLWRMKKVNKGTM